MSLFSIRRHHQAKPNQCPQNSTYLDANDGQITDSVEHYCAIKGIAVRVHGSPRQPINEKEAGDIQHHLRVISETVRPKDSITLAVKLECLLSTRTRYLTVVSITDIDNTEENALLGFDWDETSDEATLGMVLPVYADTSIVLDGDGGFVVTSDYRKHTFKPVSVQSMWSALQTLNKNVENARYNNFFAEGTSHTWINHYVKEINSSPKAIIEWNALDIESKTNFDAKIDSELDQSKLAATRNLIKVNLRDIMAHVDIEEITSKQIRSLLEERIQMKLTEFKEFIDECMIVILRQMDSASEILPYLYLGSEWNAANIDELKNKGIKYILNITCEVDNFFPNQFSYMNIRVVDKETTDLITNWDKTYKFIKGARNNSSKVLVHCKMGVSRSASTVIAYVMKEYKWPLETALQHVKSCRNCINPNPGFYNQLITYEGLIKAGRLRHSHLWRKRSYSDTSIKQLISFRRSQMTKKAPITEQNDESGQTQCKDTASTKANEDTDFISFYSCVSCLISEYQLKNDRKKEKNIKKSLHRKGRNLQNRIQAPRPVKSNPNLGSLANDYSQAYDQITSSASIDTSFDSHPEGFDKHTLAEGNLSNDTVAINESKLGASPTIVLRHKQEEDCCSSTKMLYEVKSKGDNETHSNKTMNKSNKREGSKVKGIKNFLEGISKGWQASKAILRQNSSKSPVSKSEEHKFDEDRISPNPKINSSTESERDNYVDHTLDKLIVSPEADRENDVEELKFNVSVKELTLELESAHMQSLNNSSLNTSKSSIQNLGITSTAETKNDANNDETCPKNELQRSSGYIRNIVEKFESSDCQAN